MLELYKPHIEDLWFKEKMIDVYKRQAEKNVLIKTCSAVFPDIVRR